MKLYDINYGEINLPLDVAAIVATPQFQRLLSIKQLGFLRINDRLEHEHTRYSHCIGTWYAAGKMLDALEKNTTWLTDNNNNIPVVYRKAVQVAALLHDIGHGPFSHTWERVVESYNHENEGHSLIDEIFKNIDEQLFPELRNENNYGIELVKALIVGDISKFSRKIPNDFRFIFEIVSNSRSKLDVDKWDYLKRDHNYIKHLCSPNTDFDDVFLKARVSACGSHIEYRYEDYQKIFNVFAARYHFFVNCYLLPRFLICDNIFKDVVHALKPSIDNQLVTGIKSTNMSAFLQLTDDKLLSLIQESEFCKFLKYESNYQEVAEDELKKETSISMVVNLPSVTEYMPTDKEISFYGNLKDKPTVKDETVHVSKVYRYFCDESSQTVYYTVQHQQ